MPKFEGAIFEPPETVGLFASAARPQQSAIAAARESEPALD